MEHHDQGHEMAMPAIFTAGTNITLFVSSWTTSSIEMYLLTLFFLFSLALFNRFLGALKTQIDSKTNSTHPPSAPGLAPPAARRRRNFIPKERMSPLPLYMEIDKSDDESSTQFPSAPFLGSQPAKESPGPAGRKPQESQGLVMRYFRILCGIWTPSRPWNWKHDGFNSLLEVTRAFIGYLL